MRLSRALIVILALMVSPVSAAVCEVACGMPASAPVGAAPDEHAHHGHHAPPGVASADAPSESLRAPNCDLTQPSPARLRTASIDVIASPAAITSPVYGFDPAHVGRLFATGRPPRPPDSPPHAPVPLRI